MQEDLRLRRSGATNASERREETHKGGLHRIALLTYSCFVAYRGSTFGPGKEQNELFEKLLMKMVQQPLLHELERAEGVQFPLI